MGIKVIGPKPQLSFQVGAKIEVLCQDSGIRGCWFRCKILSMSPRLLKVQYDDLLEIDGPQKLEVCNALGLFSLYSIYLFFSNVVEILIVVIFGLRSPIISLIVY